MIKDEVIDLIKDSGFGTLATMDGNQPRVRPMMPFLTEDNQLLIALLSRSRTIDQIRRNPQVEMCFVDRKMWYCRCAGKGKITTNIEKKTLVFNHVPMLRQYFASPDDPNFVLLEISIDSMEAMTPHQKQPESIPL